MQDLVADLLNVPVQKIMTRNVLVLIEDDTIPSVFRLFERSRISGAPVINHQGQHVGLITKTDLASPRLIEYQMRGRDLSVIPIRDFMNPSPLITVKENSTLMDAAKLMTIHKIHRVFIEDKHKALQGIVTTYDIVKHITSLCDDPSVQDGKEQSGLMVLLSQAGALAWLPKK